MTAQRHALHLKRAYEPAEERDGTRVLVDRLWPRIASGHGASRRSALALTSG
jgi:uncharacterized protein YeaO (DUF488 family)